MLPVVLLVALGGIVAPPLGLLVAALTGLAVAAGVVSVFGRSNLRLVPLESVIVPAVLAAAAVGAIRLVPTGVAWLPALGLVAFALSGIIRLESRLLAGTTSPTADDRFRLLTSVIGTAFLAFAGAAALVSPGLAEPGTTVLVPDGASGGPTTVPFGADPVVTLVVADGLTAGLLGFRAAAMRYPSLRDRLWSAGTYAVVVAVAAGVARAIDLPRLVGPALLTLVFYLWDAIHSAGSARRRDIRFVWETALLVVLGVVVVAWNLRLRG